MRDDRRPGDRRRSRAAGRSTPGTTCSASFPGVFGVKTGHTDGAGWSQVAAVRAATARRSTRRSSAARRARSATPTSRRCSPTGSPSTGMVDAIAAGRRVRDGRRCRTAATPLAARRRARRCAPSCALGQPLDRAGRRAGVASRCRCAGARCSDASRSGRAAGCSGARPLVAARSVAQPGARGPRRLVRAAYSPPRRWDLLTVHDRHRHAQRRVRPHDHRPELPARPAPPRERGPPARRREGDQRRPGAEDARRAGRRHRPRRRPDRACGSSSG